MIKKQGLRHILTKKSSKRKMNLRHAGVLSDVEAKRAKSMLPYA
jgi:large subunit ribosomal protein L35